MAGEYSKQVNEGMRETASPRLFKKCGGTCAGTGIAVVNGEKVWIATRIWKRSNDRQGRYKPALHVVTRLWYLYLNLPRIFKYCNEGKQQAIRKALHVYTHRRQSVMVTKGRVNGGVTPGHVAHSGYTSASPYTTDAYFATIASSFGLRCTTYTANLGGRLGQVMDVTPGALYISRLTSTGNQRYGNALFVLIAGVNPNGTMLCILPNGTTNSTQTTTQWANDNLYDRFFVIQP